MPVLRRRPTIRFHARLIPTTGHAECRALRAAHIHVGHRMKSAQRTGQRAVNERRFARGNLPRIGGIWAAFCAVDCDTGWSGIAHYQVRKRRVGVRRGMIRLDSRCQLTTRKAVPDRGGQACRGRAPNLVWSGCAGGGCEPAGAAISVGRRCTSSESRSSSGRAVIVGPSSGTGTATSSRIEALTIGKQWRTLGRDGQRSGHLRVEGAAERILARRGWCGE
jgi:hypothetical protein